jgi:hypothetical protein
MIRQVLLTAPGERADLPDFGCGLRQLIFAPDSDAVQATCQITVQRALSRWLSNQIQVQKVTVSSGPDNDQSQIVVLVQYVLIETQTQQTTEITVG